MSASSSRLRLRRMTHIASIETTAIPARAAAAYPAMVPTLGPSSGTAEGEARPEGVLVGLLAVLVVRVTVNC